jgi:hypothetical protein
VVLVLNFIGYLTSDFHDVAKLNKLRVQRTLAKVPYFLKNETLVAHPLGQASLI